VKRGICFYPSETFDSRKMIRGQKRKTQRKMEKILQFYISNLLWLKRMTDFFLTLLTGKIEQGIRQKLMDGIKSNSVLSYSKIRKS